MTALILTPGAIRAIVLAARDEVLKGYAHTASGHLDALAIALDPAHQAMPTVWPDDFGGTKPATSAGRESLHAIMRWPRFPGDTTFGHAWPEDIGSAMHAPPAPMVRAGTIPGEASKPAATAPAEPSIPTAGTPAPPTIELPAGPAERDVPRADPPAAAGAPPAPEAPPPAQAAVGHPEPPKARARSTTPNRGRAGGVWVPARDDILRAGWIAGDSAADILPRLNAIEAAAPVASEQAIYNRARDLRIERPPEVRAMMLQRAARAGAQRAAELAAAGTSSLGAKPIVWTPAREDLGKTLWEAGEHAATIMARLNELPAPAQVTDPHVVRSHASHRGWVRPESYKQALRDMHAERMRTRRRTPEPAPAASADCEQCDSAGRCTHGCDTPAAAEPAPPPPPPAEPAEPTPEESAAIADAAVATKYERVRASLRTALKEHRGSPPVVALSQIGNRHGLPLREVMRLLGEVRAEAAQGAAA